jgi:glutaredoxin
MIKKIYSLPMCSKCLKAKKENPDAEYIDILSLSDEDKDKIFTKASQIGQTSAPILLDENDDIIKG